MLCQTRLDAGYCRKRLVLNLYQFQRIFSHIAITRHHNSDGLTDVAHPFDGQGRISKWLLNGNHKRHRPTLNVFPSEHGTHAWQGKCGAYIDS